MQLYLDLKRIGQAGAIIFIILLIVLPFVCEKRVRYLPCRVPSAAHDPTRFSLDNSGPPFDENIVPKTIHFYRTGPDVHYLSFIEAVCLLAAFRFANPDKIIIHTDDVLAVTYSFSKSSHGRRLLDIEGFKRVLDVQYWPVPKHVFGLEFSNTNRQNHISNVTRLRILRKHGGIFLDNHAFLLKSPETFRHYEASLFENKGTFTNSIIVAHRDSRILDLWLKSYHHYDSSVPVHHHTDYMKSLFLDKNTFYHKFDNVVKEGELDLIIDDETETFDHENFYMLLINVPPLSDSNNVIHNGDIVTLVEKQFEKYQRQLTKS